jgi:hypothetical protein
MDWRSLNRNGDKNRNPKSVFLKNPKSTDYLKAVCYDIKVLSRFIITNADCNSIFILIGDHQPPIIAGRQDGFETPVHIISRKKSFTDGFIQYGFRQGMEAAEGNPVHHEGIYSMFMREFIRNFGRDTSRLPSYLPLGIIPSDL